MTPEPNKVLCVVETINNVEYFGEVVAKGGCPPYDGLVKLAEEAVAYNKLTTPWNKPARVGCFISRLRCYAGALCRDRLCQCNVVLPFARMTDGEYVDARNILYAGLSSSQIQAVEQVMNGLVSLDNESRYEKLKYEIQCMRTKTDTVPVAKPVEAERPLPPLPTGFFRTNTPLTFVDRVGNEKLVGAHSSVLVTKVERLPVGDDPEDDGIRYTLTLCGAADTATDGVPPEAIEPDFSVPEWTYEDSLRASMNGWDIFSDTPERDFQIERVDEVAVFKADKDAERYVWKQACGGNQLCRRALSFLAYHNPVGYADMKERLKRDAEQTTSFPS